MTDFKTKMAELAKKYNISHKRDIEWHNFVAEVEELTHPELAESEDEKIRKRIRLCLDECVHSDIIRDYERDEVLAYLEKQKDLDKMIVVSPDVWDNAINDAYENGKRDGEKQKEQKDFRKLYEDIAQSDWFKKNYKGKSLGEEQPTEIPKEPHYTKRNELFDKCVKNCDPEVMKRVSDEVDEMLQKDQKPVEWSEEDEEFSKVAIAICNRYSHKDIADWLKSLPERFNLSPKSEWSEEDERRRDGIIQWLREYQKKFNPEYDSLSIESIESLIDWFKSLRPSWKPSEEQMEAFKGYLENFQAKAEAAVGGWNNYDVMIRLYEQLKKL